MAAKEERPVYIISIKDYYIFLLLCPSFPVFHKWIKGSEVKYVPCLVPLSLKSNSILFSHKIYHSYCMINPYRVKCKNQKCKNQNLSRVCPPFFLQWCLPSAAPCIGKDFFLGPVCHFCKNSMAPPSLLPQHLWDTTSCMGFTFFSILAEKVPCKYQVWWCLS